MCRWRLEHNFCFTSQVCLSIERQQKKEEYLHSSRQLRRLSNLTLTHSVFDRATAATEHKNSRNHWRKRVTKNSSCRDVTGVTQRLQLLLDCLVSPTQTATPVIGLVAVIVFQVWLNCWKRFCVGLFSLSTSLSCLLECCVVLCSLVCVWLAAKTLRNFTVVALDAGCV